MGKFSVFQSGKYTLDLVGGVLVSSKSFLAVFEYLVLRFTMLLEECGGGIGKEFLDDIGYGDGFEVGQ